LFGGQTAGTSTSGAGPAGTGTGTLTAGSPNKTSAGSLFGTSATGAGSSLFGNQGGTLSSTAGTTNTSGLLSSSATSATSNPSGTFGTSASTTSATGLSQSAPAAQPPKSIEENKKLMLSKQRTGRFLEECKNDLEKQFTSFKNLSCKVLNFETDNYLVQNDLIRLTELINKMKNEQDVINDQLAIIEQEQEGFNGFLDAVNKEIDDKSKHIYKYAQDGSLYEEAAKASKEIGKLENTLLDVVKNINKNDEEPDLLNYEIEGNLDALFDSLNWIEAKVTALDSKIIKLQR
jgi:chromosome segregation ATPase